MTGEPVRPTVAREMHVSTSTLDRMIAKARAEGLLEGGQPLGSIQSIQRKLSAGSDKYGRPNTHRVSRLATWWQLHPAGDLCRGRPSPPNIPLTCINFGGRGGFRTPDRWCVNL
jgi:hypothetical protein